MIQGNYKIKTYILKYIIATSIVKELVCDGLYLVGFINRNKDIKIISINCIGLITQKEYNKIGGV